MTLAELMNMGLGDCRILDDETMDSIMRVPGGWLYEVCVRSEGEPTSNSATFVPEPPEGYALKQTQAWHWVRIASRVRLLFGIENTEEEVCVKMCEMLETVAEHVRAKEKRDA